MTKDRRPAEDEYFARIDAEKRARLAAVQADQDATRHAQEMRDLHYMHCGKCGTRMFTTSFEEVEVEVCPGCGAVLLDPGELEQLAGEDRSSVVDLIATLFGFRPER